MSAVGTPHVVRDFKDRRFAGLSAATVTITAVPGVFALAALAAGSPFQFGIALALCAAGCIVADFIQRMDKHRRSASPCRGRAADPESGHGACRVVAIGGRVPHSAPTVGSRSVA